jgi:PrtD family type I secretion system ABC transporter
MLRLNGSASSPHNTVVDMVWSLTSSTSSRSEFGSARRRCRDAFLGVGLFSACINILTLTGAMFMLQVYDRVIPSHSVPTLIGLAVLAAGLFFFQGLLDVIRARMLGRIGASVHERLRSRVFDITMQLPLRHKVNSEGLQPLRDLDQVRGYLAGAGPVALFDLPWIPLYLVICFLFHPLIGLTALVGALVLISLTLLSEIISRRPTREAIVFAGTRHALAEASRRNAEVIAAMGMVPAISARWREADQRYLSAQVQASDVAGGLGAVSKALRIALQSAVLGVGAYVVIHDQASPGIIIAGSILTARALAPVELVIANWRGFIAARQSWRRLNELLASWPARDEPLPLPKPTATLSVETVSVVPPGEQRLVVRDVTFALKSGSGLGIIGPSASGKSSLARALVGVWSAARGKVRLDGAALDQWTPEALGRHIGYLPQYVELFAGTVAQNIARFRTGDDPDLVLKAAKQADVHELILRLPDGYETQIGEGGAALSAGQRQRIGLARALYGDPFLVVLDEPNSNLDTEGEQALFQAILSVRQRGGIAIVIAHRPSALAAVDQVLIMMGGQMKAFAPRDEVLRQHLHPVPAPASPKTGDGEAA